MYHVFSDYHVSFDNVTAVLSHSFITPVILHKDGKQTGFIKLNIDKSIQIFLPPWKQNQIILSGYW